MEADHRLEYTYLVVALRAPAIKNVAFLKSVAANLPEHTILLPVHKGRADIASIRAINPGLDIWSGPNNEADESILRRNGILYDIEFMRESVSEIWYPKRSHNLSPCRADPRKILKIEKSSVLQLS
jgi:hypothetical protein